MKIQESIQKIRLRIDIPLLLIILAYFGLKLRFLRYVPLWDGWTYSGELIYDAISSPSFDIFKFNAVGHSSFVYLFLISFLQYFDLGNIALFHFSITILTALSIYAFYSIAEFFFPNKQAKFELYGLTFAYAFFPIIFSNSLHINIDYGVLLFFIYTLHFLLQRKFWLAALCGTGMVFSKEIGVGLYGILIFCYSFYEFALTKRTSTQIFKGIIHRLYIFLPFILFILHFITVKAFKKEGVWSNTISSIFQANFQMPGLPPLVSEKVPISYAIGVFILNFNWVLTIFLGLGVGYILVKRKKLHESLNIPSVIYLYGLFVISYFLLTAYRTFTNIRYFLPLYPLMLLLGYFGISVFFQKRSIRRLIVTILAVLFFVANFRTLDPVSKSIYGTFKFGSHDILRMTSITGECCGYGRDQLIYNLETTHLDGLLNDAISDLRPDEKIYFAYHPVVGPESFLNFDKRTFQRTIRRNGAFLLNVVNWKFNLINPQPDTIYFLEFPIEDNKHALQGYLPLYDVVSVKKYNHDGYTMNVYTLRRKGTI